MNSKFVEFGKRWVPRRARYFIQRFVSLTETKLQDRERANPHSNVLGSDVNSCDSPYRFGIVRNAAQYHRHFVAACLEMGVPFTVLDISGSDWLDVVQRARCDVLLVWPDAFISIWNQMVKDRVELIAHELNIPVFPTTREIWLYEDKRRTAGWLQAHNVPHPHTWVFYDLGKCEDFVSSCQLPIVFKASFGAAAAGVRLFRDRSSLKGFVRRVFQNGFVPDGHDRRDRQWGSVLLQEYLPNVKEWRLVRIGDSFFGHGKGQSRGIHSGSGIVEWEVPTSRHLNLLESVTEIGGYRSMAVDVFETDDGRLLVNELQTVFGADTSVHQLKVDGEPGRFVRGESQGKWIFESGDFARNACANERIRYLIQSRFGSRSAEQR